MIGFVTPDFQPFLRLPIQGHDRECEFDFLIDTGFNGFLVLPAESIAAIGVPLDRFDELELADGTVRDIRVYIAHIIFDEESHPVEIWATGDKPVLGLQLLKNHALHIEVRDGGMVSIEPLS